MNDADVAVIGLGAIGSMTAWQLTRQGASVHGYEQFGIAHDRGASAGQTRRFSVQSQGDHRLTALAIRAYESWLELESETETRLLEQVGGIIIGAPGVPAFDNALSSAQRYGLPYTLLTHDQLADRYPQHVVEQEEAAIVDPYGGFMRPELAVLKAANRAKALGAEIYDNSPVSAIVPDAHGVTVTSRHGTHRYGRVVVATGYWARRLLPLAASSILPRRLLQTWFAVEDAASYTPEIFPVFERVGSSRMFGFPMLDGASVKIIPYLGEHPAVQDVERPDRWVSPDTLERVAQVVEGALRGLHSSPIGTSLGYEAYSIDGLPLLGPSLLSPRVISAVGMSGAGFKFAPYFGSIAARYALGETLIEDVSFLDATRDARSWHDGLLPTL